MKILEPKYKHDFFNGVITGENVIYYKKFYKDLKKIYEHIDENIPDDEVLYEVYTIESDKHSELLWGLTVIQPKQIQNEYNMTRGHFHLDKNQPEIYFGLSGEGLLLFMNELGECFAEKVSQNSVHYIKGKYAHRLINTGEEILKVGASWNRIAGHDYEAIENGIKFERIFKEEEC